MFYLPGGVIKAEGPTYTEVCHFIRQAMYSYQPKRLANIMVSELFARGIVKSTRAM